jgi:methionine salvage enolase-phosphatase E1
MPYIKKTIYISEEANDWLSRQGNQSDAVDKLILAEINKNNEFVTREEVIKLIQEYVKEEVKEPNVNDIFKKYR